MLVDVGKSSGRRSIARSTAVAVLALGCSAGLGAQETCGLNFIPGPSGQIDDPSINVGDPIGGAFTLLSADLAGPGQRDLILGIGSGPPYEQSLPLRILRQNATGTGLVDVTRSLLGQGSLPSMEHPREIVVGDFNRDGKTDVYFAAHGYDAPPFAGERNVLLLSTGADTYTDQSAQLPALPDFTHSATTGDVNGDGYLDILVGNFPTPQPAYFLLGGPGGTFTKSSAGLPDDVIVANGNTFLSSLLVDLDGDRFPELVLGKGVDPDKDMVLWNDGTGSFKTRARLLLPGGAFGADSDTDDIVATDVNDDGLADLAIISTQQGGLQNVGFGLQLLVNQGDGTFADESQARLGAAASRTNGRWWTFLRVADVNRDGWDDFYAVGYAEVGVSVPIFWINRGDGTFCAADNTTFFNTSNPMEAMDIDGDGRLDFVDAFYNFQSRTLDYRSFLNRTPATLRSISVGDVTVAEGDSGTSQANVSITLSQAAAGAVAFDIFTDNGTAFPGQDYLSAAAIGLTVPAGQTSVTFPVAILGDTDVEGNETFTVNLANVRHAVVARDQGLARITNDDLASLAIEDAQLVEGTGGVRTLSFVVGLSKPMPGLVSFDIATGNGSATAGVDYNARSQAGRIDGGRTRFLFEVAVLADSLGESTETFPVTISNVVGASLSDGVAVGTILDDDGGVQGAARWIRRASKASPCRRAAEGAGACRAP